MVQNKGVIFRNVPNGKVVPDSTIKVETREFDLEQSPPDGGVIVKVLYSSFDPYMKGRMRAPEVKSYSPPFALNEPIRSHAVVKVLKSASDKFSEDDKIVVNSSMEEYAIISKEYLQGAIKLDNKYNLDLVYYIGALGMPGLTAYSSFYDIGKPKKGETIFISSAAGAVGQLVGQLAKHEGLTVIGSVGTDDKLEFLTKELKFDGGFNYKKESAKEALPRLAPNGIDIYYENVGGEQLEAALDNMKDFGRIVACGMISQYSHKPEERYGVPNLMNIIAKRLTIRGFIVGDANMGPVYAKEHQEKVSKWLSEKSFIAKVDVTEGIDNGVTGFCNMLEGKNFGKAVLHIGDA